MNSESLLFPMYKVLVKKKITIFYQLLRYLVINCNKQVILVSLPASCPTIHETFHRSPWELFQYRSAHFPFQSYAALKNLPFTSLHETIMPFLIKNVRKLIFKLHFLKLGVTMASYHMVYVSVQAFFIELPSVTIILQQTAVIHNPLPHYQLREMKLSPI